MLGVGARQAVTPFMTVTEDFAVNEATDLSVHNWTARVGPSAQLGERNLAVRVPKRLSKDRADSVGTHKRRQLRRKTLHETGIHLPDIGMVKRVVHTVQQNATTYPHVGQYS